LKVIQIPIAYVHQQWPVVQEYLNAALTHSEASGEITLDQLRADLAQNRAVLYCATEEGRVCGAAAVTFQNQRNDRVAFVIAVGGVWIAVPGAFDQFSSLLKQAGATKIAGAGRDSIVRLWSRFGLKKKYTVFEADL
jgi:hypothetical protein